MRAEAYTTASSGVPKDAEVIVTNYECAVRRLDELLKEEWDAVILDECTAIKNRRTKNAKAAHALCEKPEYVWLLTGTPVQNRPDELWSLLHCVDRRSFSSYWSFVEKYTVISEAPWGRQILGPKNLDELGEALVPYLLRRDRSVVQLPPVLEENVCLEMYPRQKKMYKQMEHEFLVVLSREKFVYAPNVLAQLTRLRQITCTPALIGGPDVSCKTDALLELVEDYYNDYKLLVFTAFATYIDRLMLLLKDYGPVKITGGASAKERQEAVDKFQTDDGTRVLLGTTRAMSEGLNLQAADIVVFLDMDWVPAVMEQAVSRAHRRGRETPVKVVKLVANGTVDEHIASVLNSKEQMLRHMDAVALVAEMIRAKAQQKNLKSLKGGMTREAVDAKRSR